MIGYMNGLDFAGLTLEDADPFWDFYWEQRLLPFENLGKRAAILAASRLIRRMAQSAGRPLRLLELGCGEGQVIGSLLDAHAQVCSVQASAGLDYHAPSLAVCRKNVKGLRCVEGDLTDPRTLSALGQFDLVLLVNTLHEVFSDGLQEYADEEQIMAAKLSVEQALAGAARCLAAGGQLLLFDGLEPEGDPHALVRIRFLDGEAREDFETFAREYRPVRVAYHQTADPLVVELTCRNFTRYITKSIFLGKHLWQTERLQSYQYFTRSEYLRAFSRLDLEILSLRTLTVNEEKWRRQVQILSPEVAFPDEHIMIVAMPGKRS